MSFKDKLDALVTAFAAAQTEEEKKVLQEQLQNMMQGATLRKPTKKYATRAERVKKRKAARAARKATRRGGHKGQKNTKGQHYVMNMRAN